jgi:hypothetical protein
MAVAKRENVASGSGNAIGVAAEDSTNQEEWIGRSPLSQRTKAQSNN